MNKGNQAPNRKNFNHGDLINGTKLVYLNEEPKLRKYVRRAKVRCECGKEWIVLLSNVAIGRTTSCGCYMDSIRSNNNRSHGQSKSITYGSWKHMKDRCLRTTHDKFQYYGGRGIKLQDSWKTFEGFLSDMGERPSLDHSIERIKVDGDYCVGNCKWATREEQANNKRNSFLITYNGETLTSGQWGRKVGINYSTIWNRIFDGWSPEKALTTPVIKRWLTGSKCRKVAFVFPVMSRFSQYMVSDKCNSSKFICLK